MARKNYSKAEKKSFWNGFWKGIGKRKKSSGVKATSGRRKSTGKKSYKKKKTGL